MILMLPTEFYSIITDNEWIDPSIIIATENTHENIFYSFSEFPHFLLTFPLLFLTISHIQWRIIDR